MAQLLRLLDPAGDLNCGRIQLSAKLHFAQVAWRSGDPVKNFAHPVFVVRHWAEEVGHATWRPAVVVSILVSVLKSGSFSAVLPQAAWGALQFAPLLLPTATLTLLKPSGRLGRSDRVLTWGLAAFLVAAFLSTIVSVAPITTIAQVGILALMTSFLALTYTRRWGDLQTLDVDLLSVYVTVCAVQIAGLVALVAGASWALGPYSRFVGFLSNANYEGMLSAVAVVLACYLLVVWNGRRRVWIALGIIPLLIDLMLSGSRGSLIAAAIGSFVFLVLIRMWRTLIVVVAALAVGAMALGAVAPNMLDRVEQNDLTSGRLQIYAAMIRNWLTSPVLGTGFRTTSLLPGTAGLAGHNIFLSVLTETGIVGFIAFLSILIMIFVQGRGGALAGAAVTVLGIEMTESSIYGWGGPTALTSWLVMLSYAAVYRLAPAAHSQSETVHK